MWSYRFVPTLLTSPKQRIQFPFFPSQSDTETLPKTFTGNSFEEHAVVGTEVALKKKNLLVLPLL